VGENGFMARIFVLSTFSVKQNKGKKVPYLEEESLFIIGMSLS
jgi:hypothetical protein